MQYDCGYFVSVSLSLCVCVFRLGKPASGNRFSGDLLVSAVESGTDAAPLPAFAYLRLDLPLARRPHHAGCGQYAYMPAVIYEKKKKEVKVQRRQTTSVWVFYGFCDWPITIVCQSTEVAM